MLVVVKYRPSEKFIFSHKLKNMAILSDLYLPFHQPSRVEKSVASLVDSPVKAKLKKVNRGRKNGQRTLSLMGGMMAGMKMEPAMDCG